MRRTKTRKPETSTPAPMLCDHANEVPRGPCQCDVSCYCKTPVDRGGSAMCLPKPTPQELEKREETLEEKRQKLAELQKEIKAEEEKIRAARRERFNERRNRLREYIGANLNVIDVLAPFHKNSEDPQIKEKDRCGGWECVRCYLLDLPKWNEGGDKMIVIELVDYYETGSDKGI